jgi:putative transposase
MRETLTLSALNMALKNGTPHQGVIHHSDRGSQYAANDYKKALKTAKITQSMSRKGNCYDNFCFFGTHRILPQNP